MKEIIKRLNDLKVDICHEKNSMCPLRGQKTSTLEHGSHEQTRMIVINSIFEKAISDLDGITSQLAILDRELY